MSSVCLRQPTQIDRLSRCLWLLASLFLIFVVFWDGRTFLQALYPMTQAPRDFFQEWASARNVWFGLPVYAPHEETIPLYLGMPARPGCCFISINAHPPGSVLLGIPFSPFSYRAAHIAWNLLSLGALAVSIAIIARTLRVADQPRTWLLVGFLILSGPLYEQLRHGQLNLVLLLLITGVWWAGRSERPGWAGTLLGVATAIKFLPGLLFLYFALRRQWYALVAGLASLLVTGLVTAAVLGLGAFESYLDTALPQVEEWRGDWLNASFPGLCYKLFDPGMKGRPVEPLVHAPLLSRCLIGVGSLAILSVVALAILRARSRRDCDVAFGLTLVAMLLISPIAWEHYFLLLLLPLAVLWQWLPHKGLARWLLLGAAGVMWLPQWRICGIYDRLLGLAHFRVATPVQTVTVFSLQFYALLSVFGLTLLLALRRLPPKQPATGLTPPDHHQEFE
jgi:hypothetical protein